MMHRFARRIAAAIAVAATIGVGCSRESITEIVAGVTTQVQVPRELKAVRLTVRPNDTPHFCAVYPVYDGKVLLPRTLGISKEHDNTEITVALYGFNKSPDDLAQGELADCDADVTVGDSSKARVLRRSRQTYREGHVLYVPLPVRYSCFETDCPDPHQTCKGGKCVDAPERSDQLQDYKDEFVYGDTSTCFDQAICLGGAVPPLTIGDCHFGIPVGLPGKGLNVRAIYDGAVSEVLDQDPDEGFTQISPTEFIVADGVCHNKAHPILSYAVSTACAPKTELQPMCSTGQQVLIPAASSVAIFLDKSSATAAYLDKLRRNVALLDIPLSDPVFSTTRVAFSFLPRSQTDATAACTATSYDIASTEFRGASDERAALKQLLDPNAPGEPATDAAPLEAYAVLRADGAYAAVKSASAASTAALNTQAVVLITGRPLDDAGQSCGHTVQEVVDAAATAFASSDAKARVRTYVIALVPPGGAPFDTQGLEKVATAGHGKFFSNAGADGDAAAAHALDGIVADLSSCFYERPGNIDDPNKATVSYVDATRTVHVVPPDPRCNVDGEAEQDANGWNVDYNRSVIRVCGQACTDLRAAHQAALDLGAAGAALGNPPPQFVVTAAQDLPAAPAH